MIAEQARVLGEQAEAIGELRSDVVALAAEVRELRRRLGRNSGNSSMAPSADDLPGRKPPEPKPKRRGGRKPGGPAYESLVTVPSDGRKSRHNVHGPT